MFVLHILCLKSQINLFFFFLNPLKRLFHFTYHCHYFAMPSDNTFSISNTFSNKVCYTLCECWCLLFLCKSILCLHCHVDMCAHSLPPPPTSPPEAAFSPGLRCLCRRVHTAPHRPLWHFDAVHISALQIWWNGSQGRRWVSRGCCVFLKSTLVQSSCSGMWLNGWLTGTVWDQQGYLNTLAQPGAATHTLLRIIR